MAATDLSGHLQLPSTIHQHFLAHPSRHSDCDSSHIVAHLRLTHAGPLWPVFGPSGQEQRWPGAKLCCVKFNQCIKSTCTCTHIHRPRVSLTKKKKKEEPSSGNRPWTWLFELARVAGTGGRIIKLCRAHTAHAHTWGYYTIGQRTATHIGPKPKRQLHKTLFTMRGCRLCQW